MSIDETDVLCPGHGVLHRSDSGEGAVSRRIQEDPRP